MKTLSTPQQLAARLIAHHMHHILKELVKDGRRAGHIYIGSLIDQACTRINEEDGGFDQEDVVWKPSTTMNRVIEESLRLTVADWPYGWSHDGEGGLMYNGGENES